MYAFIIKKEYFYLVDSLAGTSRNNSATYLPFFGCCILETGNYEINLTVMICMKTRLFNTKGA